MRYFEGLLHQPEPPMSYESKVIDHLGLVAAMIDELELPQQIDQAIAQDFEQRTLSVGQAVKAMILNGLGFVNQRLYLMPQFFESKPTERLIGKGIKSEQINDDTLGRALDALYDYGVTALSSQGEMIERKERMMKMRINDMQIYFRVILLLLFFLTVVFVAFRNPFDRASQSSLDESIEISFDKTIIRSIVEQCGFEEETPPPCYINLAEIIPFEWEEVFQFREDSYTWDINDAIGFECNCTDVQSQRRRIVFTKDDKIVEEKEEDASYWKFNFSVLRDDEDGIPNFRYESSRFLVLRKLDYVGEVFYVLTQNTHP